MTNLTVLDSTGTTKTLKTTTTAEIDTPHQNAQLVDQAGDYIVETVHNSVPTITVEHHEVHEGKVFTAGFFKSALANTSSQDILLTVPAGYNIHLRKLIAKGTNAPCDVFLYTGTTTSAAGTAVAAYNSNRASANTANLVITSTPTVTSVGTQIMRDLLVGTITGGSFEDSGSEEVVLAASTTYLFRITNRSGGAIDTLQRVAFYEVAV